MRVGILCTMINGFGRRGYYNSQEIALGKAIASLGHDVTIYKGVYPDEDYLREVVSPRVDVNYIPMKRIGAHGYFNPRKLPPGTDLLICFSDNQQFIPHIYRYCKRHKIRFIPYIGTCHSLYSEKLRGKIMDDLFRLGTLQVYKKVPVIAKNESAKEELNSIGINNVTIAPVGIDTAVLYQNFQKEDRNQIRSEFGFTENDIVLLCIARLVPSKRPLALITILKKLREKGDQYKLLLIGKGPETIPLRVNIEKAGLTDHVVWIKEMPFDEIWKAHYSADFFVNLCRVEIFGMAILEALYYNTLVAATRAMGPETILTYMDGCCIADEDQEIINYILKTKTPDKSLYSSNRKALINNFSWLNTAKRFMACAQT